MPSDVLTIKDFAELAGVSVQSIYKKLSKANNPIQRYLVVVDNVKYLRRAALDVLYSSNPAAAVENDPLPPQTEEQPPQKSSTDRLLDILETQLADQRRQLEEKDRQIAEQNAQINQLLEQLAENTKLINQQQQLTAMNTQYLTAGTPAGNNEDTDPPPVAEEKIDPPPQKRSFWSRVFSRDKKEV